MAKVSKTITTSSTAEYFSKNLQQVGFSSQTKAVLTTLKEAVDNALDACEEEGILPELWVDVEKVGAGSLKNSDQIRIRVLDNGPGIDPENVPKVFGEYLASSKFGRGRCSRGQQGIGISAATTWAQLTCASGARVITKMKNMRKAFSATVEVDIKNNKGILKDKETIDWEQPHGTSVEFTFDGRIQLNGEAGLINYIMGNVLVNPHMTIHYKLPSTDPENPTKEYTTIDRVSTEIPKIPDATEPHPHTMKLGEFIAHSHIFGKIKTSAWLKKGFSRVSDMVIGQLTSEMKVPKALFEKSLDALNEQEFKTIFTAIQNLKLMAPSTQSVLSIGEEAMAKSIKRLGSIDFFSVVSRKPTICDFKPIQIEVAVARLEEKQPDMEAPVQVLRFANRVPLQFDKAACAIVQAVSTVAWRSYGLAQPKDALPQGPYIVAVSVVSPFIKFKNASKETIDGSEELVEEIRRALMQAGQKLSRHIRAEDKAAELEEKIRHIEQFGPILVEGLARIAKAPDTRKKKAEEGLKKLLGRDAQETEKQLTEAATRLEAQRASDKKKHGTVDDELGTEEAQSDEDSGAAPANALKLEAEEVPVKKGKKDASKKEAKTAGDKAKSKKKGKAEKVKNKAQLDLF